MSWLFLLLFGTAFAGRPLEEVQRAELERVRVRVADDVHLAAFDLVDELVLKLAREPVFAAPTSVVLAGVTVPVGLGSGVQGLLENHITNVILANPASNIKLVYCPACTQVVVHSGADATVISRGVDNPGALQTLGVQDGLTALFIDVEAEGSWLVLRARLTELSPELPIVWSHTLSSAASTASLLREPDALKTAAEARDEYLDVLRERGPISVPVRAVLRSYAPGDNQNTVGVPPFLWLQSGVELAADRSRGWTASLLGGYSFIPQAYQGIMGQARVNRLITGRSRSLTHPDLYGFFGAAVISVWGPATGPLRNERLTADDVLVDADAERVPRTAFGAMQVGLDLRMGQRVGLSVFLETMPSLYASRNIGQHFGLFGIRFQSLGTEVTLWF